MALLGIAGARGVGTTLARLALRAGLDVLLYDQNENTLAEARERAVRPIESSTALSSDGSPTAPGGLRTTDLAELAVAETVIEAVVDTRTSKSALLTRLDAACPPETVLVTITGTLSITALAAATKHPERVIGLHLPRPVATTPLAEVAPGLQTSEPTRERAMALVRQLGKTPILVKNRPGFVVNRIANLLRLEAVRALEEEVADAPTIDALLGAMGFAPGPLAAMDGLGIDSCLVISRALFEGSMGEPRYQPPLLQVEMVDAGWHGRKGGRGFYEHPAR